MLNEVKDPEYQKPGFFALLRMTKNGSSTSEFILLFRLLLHPDKDSCILPECGSSDCDDEDTRDPHRREEGEEYTETEHETESLDE